MRPHSPSSEQVSWRTTPLASAQNSRGDDVESLAGSEGGSGGGTELAPEAAVNSGRVGADLVGSGANIIGNRRSSSDSCVALERSSRKYASILSLSSAFAARIMPASVIKRSFSSDGLSLHSAHCSGVGAAFAFGAPFGATMSAGGGALTFGATMSAGGGALDGGGSRYNDDDDDHDDDHDHGDGTNQ